MTLQRGDVVLVPFPFTSGAASKTRPALVVQCDRNNARSVNVILVAITSTTRRAHEATQYLIAVKSPEGKQAGLLFDSVVACENIATVEQSLVQRKIGTLPTAIMLGIDDCLRASLEL